MNRSTEDLNTDDFLNQKTFIIWRAENNLWSPRSHILVVRYGNESKFYDEIVLAEGFGDMKAIPKDRCL